jgi:hypothetical protein
VATRVIPIIVATTFLFARSFPNRIRRCFFQRPRPPRPLSGWLGRELRSLLSYCPRQRECPIVASIARANGVGFSHAGYSEIAIEMTVGSSQICTSNGRFGAAPEVRFVHQLEMPDGYPGAPRAH